MTATGSGNSLTRGILPPRCGPIPPIAHAGTRGTSPFSKVHFKKPRGRSLPDKLARANAVRAKVRAHVEHVFAVQKQRMALSCAPSASNGPEPRSAWPIWSTTSSATSGLRAELHRPEATTVPKKTRKHPKRRQSTTETQNKGRSPRTPFKPTSKYRFFEVSDGVALELLLWLVALRLGQA